MSTAPEDAPRKTIPSDGADKTIVYGVNHNTLTKDDLVVSNASCTTNCLAPVVDVLHSAFGIERGMMTTIHSYTGDQPTLDTMHKDLYRGRAAALSQIPRLIPVIEEEAARFACNAVVVDRHVVLNAGCPQLEADLAAAGFTPHATPLDEFLKAGGSAKCLTLRLDGEEAALWPPRVPA